MVNKRSARLSEAYLKEVANIVHSEIRDPRLSGVYVTQVVFTPDLRLAKVYFNVSGGRLREEEVIQGFERSKGFLKRELNRRINIKYAPDLKFYYDESSEVKAEIDRLFDQIESEPDESEPDESKEY